MRSKVPADAILSLVADGLTVRQISERLGHSTKVIRTWLARAGVKATSDKPACATAAEMQALVDEGLTLTEIARRLGRSPCGISQRLKKLGIELGEANREAARQKKVAAGRSQAERLVALNAARARRRSASVTKTERPQLPASTVQDMEAQIAAMVAAGAVTRCPTAFSAPTRQSDPVPGDIQALRLHVQAAEERLALKRRTWISRHYGNRGASA